MSALSAVRLDSELASYVLEPAIRSLVLAGAAWGMLALFRVRDVGFRLAVWTVVLYAALAMPFLGHALPEISLPLPLLGTTPSAMTGPSTIATTTVVVSERSADAVVPLPVAEDAGPANAPVIAVRQAFPQGKPGIPWPAVAAGLYCAIAGILLGRIGFGLFLSRRLRRAAQTLNDEYLLGALVREARTAGLKASPSIAESAALSVPATLGVARPMILLPPGWRAWTEGQTTAVLAHELSHIARRDPLTQALAMLHRAFFWFSPLSWYLDRALADLAEQASDDAALRAGADRARYAEVLLKFLAALKGARGRVRWQAVPMAQGARSERRLERILSGARLSRGFGQAALATVVLTAAPVICLAAALHPVLSASSQAPAPPPAVNAPPPPPAPLSPIPKVAPPSPRNSAPALPAPQHAPTPPATPAQPPSLPQTSPSTKPPTPPVPPQAEAEPEPWPWPRPLRGRRAYPWMMFGAGTVNCDGNQAYAIVSDGELSAECGSYEDMAHVRRLRRRISGSFIWFRKGDRSYVIQDPATVKNAANAFASLEALSRQQAELGRKQAQLGGKQAALGAQQEGIRINIDMPEFTAMMERLQARLRTLNSTITQETLSRIQAQLGEMQNRVGALQSEAGEKEAELGRQQAALGEQQAALGRQQAALGEKQAATARQVASQLHKLMDQAVTKGLAKPEQP